MSAPTTNRSLRLTVLTLLACLLLACAPRRLQTRPTGDAPQVGVYRGRIAETDGRSRRFRLLLFAAEPDRLHAEVVSPLGATELILDGGDARLAVIVPKERLVFAGAPDRETMHGLVGVRVQVGELVRGLLRGEVAGEGIRWRRRGAVGSLPREFTVEGGGRVLELRLKRRSPLRAAAAELGAAVAPPGFETRPLRELEWQWFEPSAVDTPSK